VALTGEGADEWLAGYPWHKVNRALSYLDMFGMPLSQWLRRGIMWLSGAPMLPLRNVERAQDAVAGHNGWHDIHGLMSLAKLRFYSPEMLRKLRDVVPLEELGFDAARMRRWHPLNRELAVGARTHLAGLMLNAKGDRVAMHSSVETRYPFLDEDVFAFLASVPPQFKYKGVFGDKYLLRKVAERWLPHDIAWRKKAMFRAPFDSFHLEVAPPFVPQLLSEQALRKTGYFDPNSVEYWRTAFRSLREGGLQRTSVEMGLVGVLATQLWHHTFLDGSLCELPSLARTARLTPSALPSAGVA
jgi:asparagine synthase (glutamine-hydrolysing)